MAIHPPRPPGPLPSSEWNARTTGPVFTIFSIVKEDVPPNRSRETREIYRPRASGDAPRLIFQGFRWTRISRTTPRQAEPTPHTPPYVPPNVPTFGAGQSGPFVGPLPPPSVLPGVIDPRFNQGLADAISSLVPAEFQQPVQAVLSSILNTGPGSFEGAGPQGPEPTQVVQTKEQRAAEQAKIAAMEEKSTREAIIKNVLVLAAGVGAVYFFFIRK